MSGIDKMLEMRREHDRLLAMKEAYEATLAKHEYWRGLVKQGLEEQVIFEIRLELLKLGWTGIEPGQGGSPCTLGSEGEHRDSPPR